METLELTATKASAQAPFPPPPPYIMNSTTTTSAAPATTAQKAANSAPAPPKVLTATTTTKQQVKTGASCECVSTSELQASLERFRAYKRSLGTVLFGCLYYLIYATLVSYFFPENVNGALLLCVSATCVLASFGCILKKCSLLIPFFALHVTVFGFLVVIFTILAFCLCHPNTSYLDSTQAWTPETGRFLLALIQMGLNKQQATFVATTMTFCAAMVVCSFMSTIWAVIELMPLYCSELHKIALSMFGSKTDLTNPVLVKHLRMHISVRSLKKTARTETV